MMYKAWIILLLALFNVSLLAQTLPKNDALKFDADYYMMEKEFGRALTTYLNILKSEPQNADIKYRIGICYLNSEEEKVKAISYLEEAAANISEDYNPSSFKEANAPVDVLFLLGSAYRVNNQIDEAIHAYTRYKDYLSPKDEYNLNVVSQYLRNCELARTMKEKPVTLIATNLGKPVNTEMPNFNAVLSGDGKTIFYTSPAKQGYDIFTSELKDSVWSVPRNVTSILGTGKYMTTCDLSEDGQTLLLALDDPMNADIYVSRFSKGKWSKVEPLGKEINSKSNETHASLSNDNTTLFFTSDRKGGFGDLDIYKSVLDEKGTWSKPVNLGPDINTPFNENTPFMAERGDRLYFSSEGHDGIGGYDIFYFDFSNPSAGVVNAGYPLNSTDNDLFYVPTGDGTTGYYAFRGQDTYGGRDIYNVYVIPPVEETMVAEAIPETVPEVIPESTAAEVTGPLLPEPALANPPAAEVAVLNEAVNETITEPEIVTPPTEEPTEAALTTNEIKENQEVTETTPPETINTIENIVSTVPPAGAAYYKIQIMALKKPVDLNKFRNLSGVAISRTDDMWYRYLVGSTTSQDEARKLLSEVIQMGYKDAFIRSYGNVHRYTVQVMAVPGPVINLKLFEGLPQLSVTKGTDNFCRYTSGEYATKEEALVHLEEIKSLGYKTAFVAKLSNQ